MGSVFWHVLFCISGKLKSVVVFISVTVILARNFRIRASSLLLSVEWNSKMNLWFSDPLGAFLVKGHLESVISITPLL